MRVLDESHLVKCRLVRISDAGVSDRDRNHLGRSMITWRLDSLPIS